MELLIPLAVIAMCCVLTLAARADTTHRTDLDTSDRALTGWVPPGHPDLGPNELEADTEPIPRVEEQVP